MSLVSNCQNSGSEHCEQCKQGLHDKIFTVDVKEVNDIVWGLFFFRPTERCSGNCLTLKSSKLTKRGSCVIRDIYVKFGSPWISTPGCHFASPWLDFRICFLNVVLPSRERSSYPTLGKGQSSSNCQRYLWEWIC